MSFFYWKSKRPPPPPLVHDVFINLRGEDVHEKIVSGIRDSLDVRGVLTFCDIDADGVKYITPTVLKAMEESMISVVIFSKNYAYSPACLDELVQIMECRRTLAQKVIPVFYDVNPSDVENLTGSYSEALAAYERNLIYKEKVSAWRSALKEAAAIAGFDFSTEDRLENLEKKTVKEILKISKTEKHKVFINFRGSDTRDTLLSDIRASLDEYKVKVFKDNEMGRGKEIEPAILKAIRRSTVSVVIFLENYASSLWCLDELVEIMECRRNLQQKVIPMFYDVDPFDVMNLTGSFGEDLAKYEKDRVWRFPFMERKDHSLTEKIHAWRSAIREAAFLPGFDPTDFRYLLSLPN